MTQKKIAESSKLVAIGVLESVFALGYLLAKQTGRVKRKMLAAGRHGLSSALSSKSLLTLPSCRKPPSMRRRNTAPARADRYNHDPFALFDEEDDDQDVYRRCDGGGELWQRSILMGDKCQPLDFSGVIYYDSDGNRVSQLHTASAKSPRATRPTSSPFAPPLGT